jgi:membrane protease YdiL (CAAX protease family)
MIVAAGVGLWLRANRSWSHLDLRAPTGIRLWIAAAVLVLLAAGYASQARKVARHERARAQVRKALASMEAILPHNGAEFTWFLMASATAGVCEEFLYRGFFNWALAPWLSWWGAAALSVPAFGLLHAYQGKKGIVRTGVVGAIMTLVVASTRSLLPAMALHSLLDVGAGAVTWIAFRDTQVGDQPRGDPASPACT